MTHSQGTSLIEHLKRANKVGGVDAVGVHAPYPCGDQVDMGGLLSANKCANNGLIAKV